MFRVFLSGHLKSFSRGRTEFALDGEYNTAGEALAGLWLESPALRDRILNEQGEIRQHVNIFYEGRDVRRLDGLDTKIAPDRELHLFNAVSGG
jgi:molybdopterin synthase sulfur carrier subunit